MLILITSLVLILGGAGLAAAGILKWGAVVISAIVIVIGAIIAAHML